MKDRKSSHKQEQAPLSEGAKYGRDTMNKVLGWGTIVYFLVLGFSLSQHDLFEFFPTSAQLQVEKAKDNYANAIDPQPDVSPKNATEAESKMKAAEARLAAKVLRDEMRDGRFRALGLMLGAAIFCIGYPFAVCYFYYECVTRRRAEYFISRKTAVWYAVGLSVVTAYASFTTALM